MRLSCKVRIQPVCNWSDPLRSKVRRIQVATLTVAAGAFVSGTLLSERVVAQGDDSSPHSEAQLIAEVSAVHPGEKFTVALRLLMDQGWHSYWKNPGAAGTPTSIEWNLPAGFEAGSIHWPYPERIPVPPLMSYGYHDEVLLLIDVTPPQSLRLGSTVVLQGEAIWLVCFNICLPARELVQLELPVRASASPDNRWVDGIAVSRNALPTEVEGWTVRAQRTAAGYTLRITPSAGSGLGDGDPYFFCSDEEVIDPAAPQPVSRQGRSYVIALEDSRYASAPVERLRGVLLAPEGSAWDAAGVHRALAVDVPVAEAAGGLDGSI
jgi:DsbC/DsbD-like thiol-disulfide interchange protein